MITGMPATGFAAPFVVDNRSPVLQDESNARPKLKIRKKLPADVKSGFKGDQLYTLINGVFKVFNCKYTISQSLPL